MASSKASRIGEEYVVAINLIIRASSNKFTGYGSTKHNDQNLNRD